jgi:acetyl-CoA acyltransferase 1
MANQTPKRAAAEERLSQVANHIQKTGTNAILQKHPDDIVVTTALRTAICKGGRGQFKDTAAVCPQNVLVNPSQSAYDSASC